MHDISVLLNNLQRGDIKALSRIISIVENELDGHTTLLQSLHLTNAVPVIGITGPPGAGKSTLVNSLLKAISGRHQKAGVIAIDPSSPFNYGALLGDRIRMSEHFNNPHVFIRSLASRGSLGGLSQKAIEVTDVMRAYGFNYIFIETVGVGQSEVEIAGLADTTVVVLVPGSGDEVQTMKAGLMEIADIFVVNKADQADAEVLANTLKRLMHTAASPGWQVPVIKTIATSDKGAGELLEKIGEHHQSNQASEKKTILLAEKAWRLIQAQRMKNINKTAIRDAVGEGLQKGGFNIYNFVKEYALKD